MKSDLFVCTCTIAKSGTNIFNKVISNLTGKKGHYVPELKKMPENLKGIFVETHFQHANVFDHILKYNFFDKILVNIRDPRDVLVSAAYFYNDLTVFSSKKGNSIFDISMKKLSIKEKIKKYLECVLNGELLSTPVYDIRSACRFIDSHKNLTKSDVLVVRFEDLIGEKGGGNKENQRKAILSMADFFNMKLTPEKLNSITDTLFGNSNTFRKGKIGNWRTYFDQQTAQMFKEVLGKELIFLGYEKTNFWE